MILGQKRFSLRRGASKGKFPSVTLRSTALFLAAQWVAIAAAQESPEYTFSTLAGSPGIQGSANGTGSVARFRSPYGVAVDSAGNVYVADQGNHAIRKVTPAGVVTTLAGKPATSGSADGTSSAARFNSPCGVAVDSAGYVYVADTWNDTVRKVTPAGVVTTLAGSPGSQASADGTNSVARFKLPYGVAVDTAGNVYVADTYNHTIRKVTPAGVVTTLAGAPGAAGSTDATGSAARFYYPRGVAVDSAGNIYVADAFNQAIRKVTPTGVVTTLAGDTAQFNYPSGVAVDSGSNVYVADRSNHTIRKVTPTGVVTTLAGLAGNLGSTDGVGDTAQFYYPSGVAVDSTRNVYVADTGNHTIRRGTNVPGQPPSIVTQPESFDVPVGGTARFGVIGSGTDPLTFQWRLAGTNLIESDRCSGVVANELTITSVQTSDAGAYSVVVSNAWGLVISSNVWLSVTAGTAWNSSRVLGPNTAQYPFAGIYEFENLYLGDYVEVTSSNISQLVIKVSGTLTVGRSAAIRVRNACYPDAPQTPLSSFGSVSDLASLGIDVGDFHLYPNAFGKGGDGGNDQPGQGEAGMYEGFCGGGGGGYGGGRGVAGGVANGGSGGAGKVGYWYPVGQDLITNRTYLDGGPGGIGGGATSVGSEGGRGGHFDNFQGGRGGAGGDGGSSPAVYPPETVGGGGGGYGGGILTIIADTIRFDTTAPPFFCVAGQKGGDGYAMGSQGEGGMLIIQARQYAADTNHWDLGWTSFGDHTAGFTNGGHGVVVGAPQRHFLPGANTNASSGLRIAPGSAHRTNGQFQFTFSGESNKVCEIWGSTNLPQFQFLQRLTNAGGTVNFADPQTNLPRRFYQVRQP